MLNSLLLATLLTSPPTWGLDHLDPQGEGGDVQDDQGGGGGALLFGHDGQGGREDELQQDSLTLGGLGGRGGVHDAHVEDEGQHVEHGGGEGVVQVDPPGRGGGVGQDCGGPGRQWGVWGGRWNSLSKTNTITLSVKSLSFAKPSLNLTILMKFVFLGAASVETSGVLVMQRLMQKQAR